MASKTTKPKPTPTPDDRQQTIQQAPPAGIDLSGFPTDPVPSVLHRAHSSKRGAAGAWYFSSDEKSRFNLAAPRGTCYAAEVPAAALRERLGPSYTGGGRAPASLIDQTQVTEIHPGPGVGVNLEHEDVGGYPITGELVTMHEYEVPRAWAEAFADAGFDGIHYRGRFSHMHGLVSWALFGDAGVGTFPTGSVITGRQACADAGILVLGPPPTDASTLRVVAPPRPNPSE